MFAELKKLRADMGRDRLRIGLIGPSQVGKSTTVANLLDVPEAESPTPIGGQNTSCTCAITRIRAVPGTGGPDQNKAGRKVTLEYMTAEEFRNRVESICRIEDVELDPSAEYKTLLQDCKKRLAAPAPKSPELLKLLVRLIEAHGAHSSCLGSQPRSGEYDRRSEYVKHSNKVSEFALLRQVVIEYPTNAVDPKLELIDLPGLGTAGRVDDLLTTQILVELDGAFIFHTRL